MTTEERISTGCLCLKLYSGLLTMLGVRTFAIMRHNLINNPLSGLVNGDLWLVAGLVALGVFVCVCSVGIAHSRRWARIGALVSVAAWLFALIWRCFTSPPTHHGVGTGPGADSMAGLDFIVEQVVLAVIGAALGLFIWLCWLVVYERNKYVAKPV
jgi:uncharacterized membrane protein (DUF2068 family)